MATSIFSHVVGARILGLNKVYTSPQNSPSLLILLTNLREPCTIFQMTTIPAATSHKKTGCDALILSQADLQPRGDVSFLKPLLDRR